MNSAPVVRGFVLFFAGSAALPSPALAQVQAARETVPVPSSGDAADDIAIWVDPSDRSRSLVIGTDKHAGLALYDLAGNQLQFLPDGDLNNVDLRYDFRLGAGRVALVTSGERSANVLAIYAVDPVARRLHNVAARTIPLGIAVYGCCMYQSQVTGETYFFGTTDTGVIVQWRLFDNGTGHVDAALVRTFDVGDIVEGCVADDETGYVYFSEENVGIWRYGAEPGAGTARVQVDHTGAGGHLTADIEGLALYRGPAGSGYLLASSQGSSSFVVYERPFPQTYRTTFTIAANPALGIDDVTNTDGIDVTNLGLGSAFPDGLFIAQDDSNPGAHQNFKLVSWAVIANSTVPPLIIAPENGPPHIGTIAATAQPRNGTGVNPSDLSSTDLPRLGSAWVCDLDCSAHAPGTAYLLAYSGRATGPVIAAGELLVDLASPSFFVTFKPHTRNVVHFSVPIPDRVELCGLRVSVQGIVSGAPALRLTNAIDLRVGL